MGARSFFFLFFSLATPRWYRIVGVVFYIYLLSYLYLCILSVVGIKDSIYLC